METVDQTDNVATIADLKDKWEQLKDVDRARAVHMIHKSGTSLRKLAKDLNCSPTLLRNLNLAAQATVLDLLLARKGKISTRELVRRAEWPRLLGYSRNEKWLNRSERSWFRRSPIPSANG